MTDGSRKDPQSTPMYISNMYIGEDILVHSCLEATLVEISPDVDNKDHEEEDSPSCIGADMTIDEFLIEETDEKKLDDFEEPVVDVVQAMGMDVEDGTVEAAEFWIELHKVLVR